MERSGTRNYKKLVVDTKVEDWRPGHDLDLNLQQIIANSKASLTELLSMISGDAEAASEFLSRYSCLSDSSVASVKSSN